MEVPQFVEWTTRREKYTFEYAVCDEYNKILIDMIIT